MKRVLVAVAYLLTGSCAVQPTVEQGNYLTYDHAFTERAADEVRKKSEAICTRRKQAAEKVSTACSLTRCVTHYQCVNSRAEDQQPAQR